MLHARLMSGALGTDLSMLGFADQLSGGLGDGGFFRVSAQSAENSRSLRTALNDMYNWIMDIHTLNRYGMVFTKGNRPVNINFYGSISALEAEKQRTRTDQMGSGGVLVQTMQQMKEMKMPKQMFETFLSKQMGIDEDQAKMYAAIADIKSDADDDAGGGFHGGGKNGAF